MRNKVINDGHHLVGVKKVQSIISATVSKIDGKYYVMQDENVQGNENYPVKLKKFNNSKVCFWVPTNNSYDYCFMGYADRQQVMEVDYTVKAVFNILARIERILRYHYHYNTTKFSKQTMPFYKFRSWVLSHDTESYKKEFINAKTCICNLNGGDYREAMRYVRYWECGLAYCMDYQ